MTRLHVSMRFAPCSHGVLHARTALPVVEAEAVWYESFAPYVWRDRGQGCEIQDGHHGTPIGSTIVVSGCSDDWFHADCQVESDDPKVLERIRVGAPVSVGFDPISSDDDYHLRLRRHRDARLDHIAILKPGEIPAFAGARITAVTEAKAKARTAALTDAQAYDELWRRVDQGGEEFMDAHDALGGRDRPRNWYLPAHPYQRAA